MVGAQISAPLQPEVSIAAPGFNPGVPIGRDLVLLRAVFGQDEANHGTIRYPVDHDGLVRVPLDAAGPLITIGGFVLAKTGADLISAGSLKLHNDTATGCSCTGRQYISDENGNVVVPAEATSELSAHGFVPVSEEGLTAPGRGNRLRAIVR